MFARPIVSELVKRMREVPRSIIYVSGPRQTGKTTAILQALAKADIPYRYCAADAGEQVALLGTRPSLDTEVAPSSMRDGSWIVQNWYRSRIDARRSERGFVLVLDEIQSIPDWSLTVKGLWDADRFEGLPLRVVVLGSAHLRLQSGLRESLAGRFEPLRFTHWSLAEMSEAFGFDTTSYVYFGGSPGAARLVHDEERWRRYVLSSLVECLQSVEVSKGANSSGGPKFRDLVGFGGKFRAGRARAEVVSLFGVTGARRVVRRGGERLGASAPRGRARD